MTPRNFSFTATIIFAVIALVQLGRAFFGWPVMIDAYAVPLWVVVPASVTVALDADVPGDESLFAPADTSSRRISVLIPRVLAGQSVSVGMTLTATVDVASLPLNASVQAPWFRTLGQANAAGQSTSLSPTCVSDPARPGFADCLGLYYNYALLAAEPLAGAKAPSAALGGGATILAAQAGALGARRILADSDNCNPVDSYSQGDKDGQEDGKGRRPFRHPNKDRMYNVGYFFGYAVGTIAGVAAAAGAAGGPSGGAAPNDARAQAVSGHVKALDSGGAACPVPPPPPPPSIPAGGSGSSSSSGGSIDPNDLIGPAGDGSTRHFIRNGQPFGYEIAFENQPTASLPAARVVITDRLDPAKFDLTTFRLGSIAFGSTTISVPPGLQSYATTQAIDATMSVRVQGSIDTSTGVAKWTFDTIDPLTRMTPSDPTLGFLPPDTDGRKGQGTVTFSVTPKVSLADATPVANQASIVFDANPAIATPAWSNTLDLSAPTAKVQAIRPQAGSTSFDVDWSGTDAGSGVRNYTVYVADGSAPFTPWLTQSSATTATYAGVSGHRYAFYVIGNDGAGNTEPAKSAAEASVTVDGLFAAAPAAASSGGGGGCTIAGGDRRDLSLPLLVLLALLVLLQRRYRARSQLVAYNAALK